MAKKKGKKRDEKKKAKKKDKKREKKAAKLAPAPAKRGGKKAAKTGKKAVKGSKSAVARRLPETLRLRALMPSLVVNDLTKSLSFYRDGLGFVVIEEMKDGGEVQGVRLKAGRTLMLLAQDDFALGRDRVKGQGVRLYCVTKQPVDAVAERARAQGITIATEPTDQPWGARDFGVVDPDGFKISIANWTDDK